MRRGPIPYSPRGPHSHAANPKGDKFPRGKRTACTAYVLHQLCTLRRTCAYASIVPVVLGPFTRHLAHSQGRARSQLVVSCPAHPPPRWLRAHTTQRYYMLCGPWSWERPLRRECLNARATLCTVTAPPNLSTPGCKGYAAVWSSMHQLTRQYYLSVPNGRRPWGVVHGVPSLNRLHATLRIIFASAALWRLQVQLDCKPQA